ncbi:MAG: hypothetical protein GJ680_01245 [Alteromonadaceae bacterium]|nr:hypothetical protein [Alteromonadaceae bacterium]
MKTDSTTPNHPFYEKVETLLSSMTIREKLGQCVMIEPCFCLDERTSEQFGESYDGVDDPKYLSMLLEEYHIGAFLFGGASQIEDGSAKAWATYINKVSEQNRKTRLKIPMMYGIDAVHGVNFMKGSTIYTHNLAVAGTWNPALTEQYASTVGAELSALGFNLNFSPTIDTARDVRWGRVYESLGEDPFLASQVARALVKGMQSSGNLAACAKHFLGYGESRNGMDRTQADLSDRVLLEMHAPPFEAAIEEDVLTMMVNGADVNGVPVPVSKKLLTGLLRDKMAFKGITMSDWEDVERLYSRHKVVTSRRDSLIRSFNAGLDMNMAVCNIAAVDTMESAVREGSIAMERVDQAVRNILLTKYKLGLFDADPVNIQQASVRVGNDESKKLAKQLATESITLLKNDNNLLPLKKNLKSVLVTGQSANSKRHLCAGWTLGWASAEEDDLSCATLLDAIKTSVSHDTTITYAASTEELTALNLNKEDFDVCIAVISEEPHAEWTGDSFDLALEEEEEAMLKASVATEIPVVMVSMIGRPLKMNWAHEHVSALLWIYSPGTEGAAATADILFGDANPSGKLPISFPQDGSQVPCVYNARSYQSDEVWTRYEPLYEFGFGLSYTSFAYSELCVPTMVKSGEDITVSVTVTNTGERAGEDIVQLYLRDQFATVTRPLKSLKAFRRIQLEPGESKTVQLTLTPAELGLYDEELNYVVEARKIDVLIGDLTGEFRIED